MTQASFLLILPPPHKWVCASLLPWLPLSSTFLSLCYFLLSAFTRRPLRPEEPSSLRPGLCAVLLSRSLPRLLLRRQVPHGIVLFPASTDVSRRLQGCVSRVTCEWGCIGERPVSLLTSPFCPSQGCLIFSFLLPHRTLGPMPYPQTISIVKQFSSNPQS